MARKIYANMRISATVHAKLQDYCMQTQYNIGWFVEHAILDAIENGRSVEWAKAAVAKMPTSTRHHDLGSDIEKAAIKRMIAPAVVVAPEQTVQDIMDAL